MKIWHIVSNRWNSAISEYALSNAKATRHLGYEVLITALEGSPIEKRFLAEGFTVQSVDGFGPIRYPTLLSISAKFKADAIFTYGGPETTAGIFLKKRTKLIRFQGYRAQESISAIHWAKKLGQKAVDCFIAPSQLIANDLKQVFDAPVEVIPLGCDSHNFKFHEIERASRPELLIFGRLDPVKGHREFLPIFKKVCELSREKNRILPKLRIVGLAENLSAVHILEASKRLDISEESIEIQCVRVTNVAEFMSKVTLGVVSSLGSEIICRVAEEFLLCGTPVVTTDVGSLKEVFLEPSFGEIFEMNCIAESAQKIFNRLYDSHSESLEQRRIRSKLAQKYFSIESMSLSIQKLLTNN